MNILTSLYLFSILFLFCIFTGCKDGTKSGTENHDWPGYLGDGSSSQYSTLNQITPENVNQLQLAWTFEAGGADGGNQTNIQCNPLIIDGVVYAISAKSNLIALNGASGEQLWRMNPFTELNKTLAVPISTSGTSRGVAYWTNGKEARILFAVANYLLAIDPKRGQLIKSFGQGGKIDLKKGLGRNIDNLSYGSGTPGVIFKDLIIMGSRVSESLPAAPGHIRAFNVLSGEQVWRFNTIPQPGEFGYDTWPTDAYKTMGGANAWAGLSVDEERGLVYCPTGSATFDYYGGDRLGQNLFANSLICLDAQTGKRVWHYQIIHHDLHDYDLPSPPNLLTIKRDGKEIPAVSQLTKQGFVFVFNRETGEPLFPIEERPVPKSDMPDDQAWPTQPRPTKPAPYIREHFTIDQVNDITPETKQEILSKYSTLLPHIPFRQPDLKQDTIVHPGMVGGAEWGGGATDPNGVLYFNANQSSALLTMIDVSESKSIGQTVYQLNCMACHGPEFKGGTAFGQVVPTLEGLFLRKTEKEIQETITNGGPTMPPFRHLAGKDVYQLMRYLESPEESAQTEEKEEEQNSSNVRFLHTGNNIWRTTKGYPAIKPPWGTLNAIDLNTGEYLWTKVFGEYPELIAEGKAPTGRENFGGPIVTASGVLFIGASLDGYLRAYDKTTGNELWRDELPAGGYATPATYMANGKQYIIIACGGGRGSPSSDSYAAYSLPD
ncbi:MAG: PQQ-binding-like beta-propeller repeat protein [Verrucomicrobia bacterium]|nr:PQQ-binding-like beta-propeller repeat protein [Verrucomicrobiota bacterium]